MIEVKVRANEPIDNALKRLKSRVMAEGVMENVYRKRAFETPQEKRKRKQKLMHKAAKYLNGNF